MLGIVEEKKESINRKVSLSHSFSARVKEGDWRWWWWWRRTLLLERESSQVV